MNNCAVYPNKYNCDVGNASGSEGTLTNFREQSANY